ncbi:MAG: P-loop NTPase fold protein [Opitutaceae bacterium]|jgi:hypothetical protein
MKLRRPPLQIDPENPFAGAFYKRVHFAKSLTSLLRSAQDGMVVFVNAPWGAGKTTFAQMWRAYLNKEKLDTISFDAYASDYVADPFISFTGEIMELLEKRIAQNKGVQEITRNFREAAVSFLQHAAPVATKIAVKVATAGILNGTELKGLGEALASSSDDVSDATAEAVRRRIDHYSEEKAVLANFRTKLRQVAALVRDTQGFPLTIIVDELDRCRPSFALELLERIKHLFDVEGVVFILLVNRAQIETYVRTVYGNEVEAATYLQKFGDLFVDLPMGQSQPNDWSLRTFFETLIEELEIEPPDSHNLLAQDLAFFGEHFGLTLREAEHVAKTLALDYAALTTGDFNYYPVAAFFAIVKVKNPTIFSKIRSQEWSGKDVLMALRFEKLKAQVNSDEGRHGFSVIEASLLNDVEIEALAPESSLSKIAKRMRGTFGPALTSAVVCSRLERFRF